MDEETGLESDEELEGQPIIRDIEVHKESMDSDAENDAAAENDGEKMAEDAGEETAEDAVEENNVVGNSDVSAEKVEIMQT